MLRRFINIYTKLGSDCIVTKNANLHRINRNVKPTTAASFTEGFKLMEMGVLTL